MQVDDRRKQVDDRRKQVVNAPRREKTIPSAQQHRKKAIPSAPCREKVISPVPIYVLCQFCKKIITSSEVGMLQRVVSNHVKTACPVIRSRPDVLKQTLQGKHFEQASKQASIAKKSPDEGQHEKALTALHLEVRLAKHEIERFRRSRYKLEKFGGQSLPITKTTVGILMAATVVTFEGDLGTILASQAWSRIEKRLLSLTGTHKRIYSVEIVSKEAGAVLKDQRPFFHVRANFYFASQGDSLNTAANHEMRIEELAVNAMDNLNLIVATGATRYVVISQELLRNEDFFVPYKVTIPLASSTKAVKIIMGIWSRGGAFITADPPPGGGERMKVPVQRAWITNMGFQELTNQSQELPLSKMLLWILKRVTGSTECSIVGQTIGDYWAFDFSAPT
mmetsp:Transcript_39791/g.77355  ORF Transcript_39791/g.77355 Transcript_39791/m.77355 type:complete len:393 (-) Transcript_39791:419-1597(-)